MKLKHHRASISPEQELQILRRELLHRYLIIVDRAVDHIRLLLLQHHDPRLDRVLDAETRDDAGTALADAVAAVGALPFGGRIPPAISKCSD